MARKKKTAQKKRPRFDSKYAPDGHKAVHKKEMSCLGCVFYDEKRSRCMRPDDDYACSPSLRPDGKNVIFVKLPVVKKKLPGGILSSPRPPHCQPVTDEELRNTYKAVTRVPAGGVVMNVKRRVDGVGKFIAVRLQNHHDLIRELVPITDKTLDTVEQADAAIQKQLEPSEEYMVLQVVSCRRGVSPKTVLEDIPVVLESEDPED